MADVMQDSIGHLAEPALPEASVLEEVRKPLLARLNAYCVLEGSHRLFRLVLLLIAPAKQIKDLSASVTRLHQLQQCLLTLWIFLGMKLNRC